MWFCAQFLPSITAEAAWLAITRFHFADISLLWPSWSFVGLVFCLSWRIGFCSASTVCCAPWARRKGFSAPQMALVCFVVGISGIAAIPTFSLTEINSKYARATSRRRGESEEGEGKFSKSIIKWCLKLSANVQHATKPCSVHWDKVLETAQGTSFLAPLVQVRKRWIIIWL